MTNERREKVKQDLIDATIECIAEKGLQNATIRNIAQKVGVNSSAISYYFGSRDKLVSEALDITLDNAFTLEDLDFTTAKDYKDVLRIILEDWKIGAKNHPGVCHAHFDDIINNQVQGNITTDRINSFIRKVYDILMNYGMDDNEISYGKLKLIFGSLISTIILPSIASPSSPAVNDIELLVDML